MDKEDLFRASSRAGGDPVSAQWKRYTSRFGVEDWGLLVLVAFCVVALVGYATFGRHPHWLSMLPIGWQAQLTWFYGISFRLFGEGQSWLAGVVLVLALVRLVGWRWWSAFVAVYALSFLSEYAGTTLGFPFGSYHYSELLGWKLLGHVPLVIPVSWFFMAIPAYVLALWTFPQEQRWFARVVLGALLLSMWDLSLDPAMSYLNRYWIWAEKGHYYYGMPLINFFGWYVTSLAVMAALVWLRVDAWVRELPVRWMAWFYGLNVGLSLGMVAIGGLWGAVALNLFAYQVCVLGMLWARRRTQEAQPPGGGKPAFFAEGVVWRSAGASSNSPDRGSVSSGISAAALSGTWQRGEESAPIVHSGAILSSGVSNTSDATSFSVGTQQSEDLLKREREESLDFGCEDLLKREREESLKLAQSAVGLGLQEQSARLEAEGLPKIALEGQMIRPLVGYGIASSLGAEDARFWQGALAVQMVHEASLLHDDIIDEAAERRGQPTLYAERGVGAALVMGDHFLTAAYRVVAQTGSLPLMMLFARVVERTVAGELCQARAVGKELTREAYEEIVDGKSGELFGFAMAIQPILSEDPQAMAYYALGRRLGCLYQMLDDLLDCCPRARTGKPAFQDYLQGKWTWPRAFFAVPQGEKTGDGLCRALFRRVEQKAAMERALSHLDEIYAAFLSDLRELAGAQPVLCAVVSRWQERAHQVIEDEVAYENAVTEAESAEIKRLLEAHELVGAGSQLDYFAQHSKSFRFASQFFPKREMEQVAGVYAFCRYTDDLVDGREGLSEAALHRLLDAWKGLARVAYEGKLSEHPLLGPVMGEMEAAGVPFAYVDALIEGVRMDIAPRRYRDMEELQLYTYRVASVVGCWLTELFGVHDREVLRRASSLGHAMQLTNILRDVSEDWRMGRLYLPASVMAKHGVDEAQIAAMVAGKMPITSGYRACLQEIAESAMHAYEEAFVAIPCLPEFFQRPVAVAATVYKGIQDRLAERGFDNLSERVYTTKGQKMWLAWRSLRSLRQERLRWKRPSTQPFVLQSRAELNG